MLCFAYFGLKEVKSVPRSTEMIKQSGQKVLSALQNRYLILALLLSGYGGLLLSLLCRRLSRGILLRLFQRGIAGAVPLVLMLGTGKRDNLGPLGGPHHADTARVTGLDGNLIDRKTDNNAVIRDQDNVISIVDYLDARDIPFLLADMII